MTQPFLDQHAEFLLVKSGDLQEQSLKIRQHMEIQLEILRAIKEINEFVMHRVNGNAKSQSLR